MPSTKDMYISIADAFARLESDETLRRILLRANGDTFCAGNDINFFLEDYDVTTELPVGRFLKGLETLRKPMVAAVQGAEVGIGLIILLHCNLVYATENVKLSAPFVRLGLVPEAGSSQLLPALIGHRRAMEIFMLGKIVQEDQALSYGLINSIIPSDQLHTKAFEAARNLAELPFESLCKTKKLARKPPEALSMRIAGECKSFMRLMKSEGSQRIFMRFLKRD